MITQVQGVRKLFTMPTDILKDKRLSVGAKGLYAQIIFSNDDYSSVVDLTDITTNSSEELKSYWAELVKVGYVDKDNKLRHTAPKAQNENEEELEETIKKAEEFAETQQPRKLSIYEKIALVVDSYNLSQNVKNLLMVYFTKRLNKEGRFADAEDLHKAKVNAMVGELVSFNLNEDEALKCVQQSIDRQWFKFFKPRVDEAKPTNTNSGQAKPLFDKTQIISGTYTAQDVAEIKKQAEELNKNGEKGIY